MTGARKCRTAKGQIWTPARHAGAISILLVATAEGGGGRKAFAIARASLAGCWRKALAPSSSRMPVADHDGGGASAVRCSARSPIGSR